MEPALRPQDKFVHSRAHHLMGMEQKATFRKAIDWAPPGQGRRKVFFASLKNERLSGDSLRSRLPRMWPARYGVPRMREDSPIENSDSAASKYRPRVTSGLSTIWELPEKHQTHRRFASNQELLILTAVG